MGAVAVSRWQSTDVDDLPPASVAAAGARRSRARTSRRWRRHRRRQRSIRTSCCGASAMPAPGAATGRSMARPICAAPFSRSPRSAKSAARPPSWRGARTRWPGTSPNSDNPSARPRDLPTASPAGKILGGTGLSNPMKTFFGIEKFKLKGRKVDGGYMVQRRAALGVQSRPRPFLRHDLRARGRARRDRDVSRRLFRSRHHAARRASRSWRWTAPAPMASSSATFSSPTTDPRRSRRAVREENPRRLHPAAGRHGDRPDPGLHRDHGRSRRAARPRQPLSAATAGAISGNC